MRTEHVSSRTIVVLSRRNLLALLAKLDGYTTGSSCTLVGDRDAPGIDVRAEEDDEHYRGRRPGRVHPATEARIKRPDPRCSGPGYAHGPHGDCPGYSTDRT